MVDLTLTERTIIVGYCAGTPIAEIGVQVKLQSESVVSLATRLRKRGYYLPYYKPVSDSPRRVPPPRFTASGITPEGCPTTVTADTQADADAGLAAMEAEDG